jgi:hypothetical protein
MACTTTVIEPLRLDGPAIVPEKVVVGSAVGVGVAPAPVGLLPPQCANRSGTTQTTDKIKRRCRAIVAAGIEDLQALIVYAWNRRLLWSSLLDPVSQAQQTFPDA